MAVAFDAVSNATEGTGDLSWTHTPVGTPRGITVRVMQPNRASDDAPSATYGGTAMTEVTNSPSPSTNCSHRVYEFFLGSSIPTGAQTVSVTGLDTTAGGNRSGVCISMTAAADTEVVDTATIDDATATSPTGTLSLGGAECFCSLAVVASVANNFQVTPL